MIRTANAPVTRPERHTGLSTVDLPKPTFQPGSYVYEIDNSNGHHTKYRVGRLLGRGGFAKCYEVSDANGSYALKAVNRASLEKPKTLQKLHTEIAIHKRMKHKHIVNFIKTFKDRYYVYILLEKCDCGTLMDLIKVRPLTVAETQYVMLQCLSAMQYMQDNYVIHRDLKPGNIMIDSELNIKIGDFGLAAELQYDGERKRTICGTPNYIAPEIIDRKSQGHSYEVDAWSLGVILYTLLTGNPPFQMEDVEATYNRIRQCKYDVPPTLSSQAKDLVAQILQSKPSERPTLLDIRTHAFFNTPPPPLLPPTSFSSFGLHVPDRQRRATVAEGNVLREVNRNAQMRGLKDANRETRAMPPPSVAPVPTPTPAPAPAYNNVNGPRRGSSPAQLNPQDLLSPNLDEAAAQPKNASPRVRSPQVAHTRTPVAPAPTAGTEDDDERADFTALHDKLHQTLLGDAQQQNEQEDLPSPAVWVTECADFSSKYGLCYKLSSGHTGAHFNDSTKMVWEPITDRVEYYARVRVEMPQRNGEVALFARDQLETFSMNSYPSAMEKKVTLIKYFRTYLNRTRSTKDKVEVVTCSPYMLDSPVRLSDPHVSSDFVYVKRWLRTDDAMVFRLSNKTVQVCFNDRAEVILSSEWKVVTYTDSQGNRQTLPLSNVGMNTEAAERLRFTKNILYQLLKDHCL